MQSSQRVAIDRRDPETQTFDVRVLDLARGIASPFMQMTLTGKTASAVLPYENEAPWRLGGWSRP